MYLLVCDDCGEEADVGTCDLCGDEVCDECANEHLFDHEWQRMALEGLIDEPS